MAEAYLAHRYHEDGDFIVYRLERSAGGIDFPSAIAQVVLHPHSTAPTPNEYDGLLMPTEEEIALFGETEEDPEPDSVYPWVEGLTIRGLMSEMKEPIRQLHPQGVDAHTGFASEIIDTDEQAAVEWFASTLDQDEDLHTGMYL